MRSKFCEGYKNLESLGFKFFSQKFQKIWIIFGELWKIRWAVWLPVMPPAETWKSTTSAAVMSHTSNIAAHIDPEKTFQMQDKGYPWVFLLYLSVYFQPWHWATKAKYCTGGTCTHVGVCKLLCHHNAASILRNHLITRFCKGHERGLPDCTKITLFHPSDPGCNTTLFRDKGPFSTVVGSFRRGNSFYKIPTYCTCKLIYQKKVWRKKGFFYFSSI